MAGIHVVKQGEQLSGIALQSGFRDFLTIWNHPNNAALRELRDPHVLFPGDRLFIPDPQLRIEQRGTGATHVFTANASRVFLRLKILDINSRPVKKVDCDAFVGSDTPDSVTTDGNGLMDDPEPLDPALKIGRVIAHIDPPTQLTFDLRLGALNPEFKLSGQQARLNNLGYFAGFTLRDLDQLLWAAEEFECDQIVKPVAKRPEIVPAPVGGEDDENNPDPNGRTGIQDANIIAALKKVHGI